MTKYYKHKIKVLRDVIEGTSTPVKVSKPILKEYKARGGYRVVQGRVIVPTEMGAMAEAREGRYIERTTRVGNAMIEEVLLPVDARNIHDWIDAVKADPDRFDRLLGPGWETETSGFRWGFKFYGQNSFRTYRRIDLLADDLEKYQTIAGSRNDEVSQQVWQNFVLYKISSHAKWENTTRSVRKRKRFRQAPEGGNYRVVRLTPEQKRERSAARKKKQREGMSEEKKAKARDKDRDRKRTERGTKGGFKFNGN